MPTARSDAAVSTAIPFRPESDPHAVTLTGSLALAAMLLAAFALAAWLARKRGWLNRFGRTAARADKQLRHVDTHRLSRHTTVFFVDLGERRYLITESTASVTCVELDRPCSTSET